MKRKGMVALFAAAGLLVAIAALAADAAKQADEKIVKREVVRLAPGEGDEFSWDDEGDDLGLLAFAGDDDDDDGRIVIRERIRGRMGRGMGAHRGMGMGPGFGRGMGRGMGMALAFRALDLTDAQREKMAALHEKQARKDIQARADLQLARLDLHGLMKADRPDAAAINAQIDKLARLQAEMRKAHVGTFLEARALLTPEQQKQLEDMHVGGPGRGPGRGKGAGRGMGDGPHGPH